MNKTYLDRPNLLPRFKHNSWPIVVISKMKRPSFLSRGATRHTMPSLLTWCTQMVNWDGSSCHWSQLMYYRCISAYFGCVMSDVCTLLTQIIKCPRIEQYHGPLTRYVKLQVAHAPGMSGTFSPSPCISDPDMHHGTCLTHVPWCMPGSLTSSFLWSRWRGKRSWHSRRMRNP